MIFINKLRKDGRTFCCFCKVKSTALMAKDFFKISNSPANTSRLIVCCANCLNFMGWKIINLKNYCLESYDLKDGDLVGTKKVCKLKESDSP